MPYKREYHKIICPKCHKEYSVLTQAWKRKLKDIKYGMLCTSCRAKVLWEEMSPEQKQMMHDRSNEANRQRFAAMSDEEKAKQQAAMINGVKRYWSKMSAKERVDRLKEMSEKCKQAKAKWTDERRKEVGNKISKGKKEAFENMPIEDRKAWASEAQKKRAAFWEKLENKKEFMDNLQQNRAIWFNNLSEDDRQHHIDRMLEGQYEYWESLDDVTKRYKMMRLTEENRKWRESLTEEEIAKLNSDKSASIKSYWENVSPERYKEFVQKHKDWWNSLSDEERLNHVRNVNIGNKHNKLQEKFERAFKESHLVNSFYLVPEYPCMKNGIKHCWDYAIFNENNELKMVVDLDGAYFHADNSDYDGLHSHEEYDTNRAQSVPDNVLHCIILEQKFKMTFEWMLKHLMDNYDTYVMSVFTHLRMMPFPYPYYSDKELLSSWNQLEMMKCDDTYHQSLSLNTRVGDRLIQHFHHSIWHDRREGELSPYEAWQDDDIMLQVIQNRIIYQTHLNPNKILQGFNIAKKAPKVSVFSAGRAKMIIDRLLKDYDTIFDPFSGYSGRMLGAISLHKRYIGQDISETHVRESNQILDFLRKWGIRFKAEVTQKDTLNSTGKYPCLFTCSPYSDIEQWDGVPVNKMTCDDWIDVCLVNFKCERYVFIVDKTDRYKDKITEVLENKSHFGSNHEYIIVIDMK